MIRVQLMEKDNRFKLLAIELDRLAENLSHIFLIETAKKGVTELSMKETKRNE